MTADPLVEIAIDGRTFVGLARVLLDDGEAAVARRLVEQKYRGAAPPWSAAPVPIAISLLAER